MYGGVSLAIYINGVTQELLRMVRATARKIGDEEMRKWERTGRKVVCEFAKGDALLMRPLLLHASWPAVHPEHRRVIHIEYATRELPGRLRWFPLIT